MSFFLILFLFASSFCLAQNGSFNYRSQNNIKLFADFLFCDEDYLRAILEYKRLNEMNINDTINFKIALGYVSLNEYEFALHQFSSINASSVFYYESKIEKLKTYFLMSEFSSLRNYYLNTFTEKDNKYLVNGAKLFNFSYLFSNEPLPEKDKFIFPFDEGEKKKVEEYYSWKLDPPFKSSAVAGIMSAIIPGSGKMYVGEWGDGITALIVTGLFAFLAVDNFNAEHNTRAWIFTALGTLFYAGNIYGSVASAQIYNARIAFEFNDGLNLYLQQKNYFAPEYNFCE